MKNTDVNFIFCIFNVILILGQFVISSQKTLLFQTTKHASMETTKYGDQTRVIKRQIAS